MSDNPGSFIDLSRFNVQRQVRAALHAAQTISQGEPLSAHDLLISALIVDSGNSSGFAKWASFFPEGARRQFGVRSLESAPELEPVDVNSFLEGSFETAQGFFAKDDQIWGRDYITLALLATEDPSLGEIASIANRSIESLRDEWFWFVSSDGNFADHRPWVQWWAERGLPIPELSAGSPQSSPAVGQAQPRMASQFTDAVDPVPATGAVSAPKAAAAAAAATSGFAPAVGSSAVVEPPLVEQSQSQQIAPNPPEIAQPTPAATAETAPTRPPDVWMLSDRPLESHFDEQDRFQFKDYADALAAIIDHEKTETPFTMAINAPWGAGKTTLANMIAEQLEQRPKDRGQAPHIICWFNAWMHDDAANLATALISEIGRKADGHRPVVQRILHPLPAALMEPTSRNRLRILIAAFISLLVVVAALWVASHLKRIDEYNTQEASKTETYQSTTTTTMDPSGKITSKSDSKTESKSAPTPTPQPSASPSHEPIVLSRSDRLLDALQSRMVVLAAFITGLAALLGVAAKMLASLASTPLAGYVQSPDKAAEAGAIQPAQQQLKKLISQATWRRNRFVVFVDDIERCQPPRSVDILDAVNQLLDHQNVVVIFLGDMAAVAAAVQLKYKDIAEIFVPSAGIAQTGTDRGKEAFGRLYLQKIIQFQFDLPIPPMKKIRAYLQQLAATPQSEGGENGRG